MPGSSVSVANANIVLNTAVAESLSRMYEAMKDVPQEKLGEALHELLRTMLIEHKRILFNGNGYTDEWIEEAERRGLDNLKALPDAMPRWISDKSLDLFTKHGIFTKEEIYSRYEILLENYVKTIHIESLTMQEMVRKDFIAGLVAYMKELAAETVQKKQILPCAGCVLEESLMTALDADAAGILKALKALEEDTKKAEEIEDLLEAAKYYEESILADMDVLRAVVDHAEALIPEQFLPYPTYGKLLFSLR